MSEPQATGLSSISCDFASLLAKLTSPQPGIAAHADGWDDSPLADDVATISYEQALRTQSRVSLLNPSDSSMQRTKALSTDDLATHSSSDQSEIRKGASISIRLSNAERAQLRQRAAEAGLSVSAYLRSCIFEAESLRAQVREALMQFRAAGPNSLSPATSRAAIAPYPKAKGRGRWPWPFGRRTS